MSASARKISAANQRRAAQASVSERDRHLGGGKKPAASSSGLAGPTQQAGDEGAGLGPVARAVDDRDPIGDLRL